VSYAPGAPAQIWALTGVSDGAKLLALWWWGKADHETQRDPKLCTVWAPAGSREDGSRMTPHESLIADARAGVHPGKADRTIRGYIAELAAARLADVDGRCVDLWPPALAAMRQNVAKPRRKSAGEILPDAGENPPSAGEILPDVGENPPSHSYPPYPPSTPHDLPTAVEPAPGAGHPCTVLDSTEGPDPVVEPTPPSATATSSPTTRRRKPPDPPPGQTGFALPEPPQRDLVGELLEAHRQARETACVDGPAWPAKATKRWSSMQASCRAAVAKHGFEWCTAMLAWRVAEWRRDPGQWAYSTGDVWRPANLDYAKRAMAGSSKPPARASPSRTLPVEPNAPDRTYRWQD
jgi:hypothetical protein